MSAKTLTATEAERLQDALREIAEHPARQARKRYSAMLGCQHKVEEREGLPVEGRCSKCLSPSWAILAARTRAEQERAK